MNAQLSPGTDDCNSGRIRVSRTETAELEWVAVLGHAPDSDASGITVDRSLASRMARVPVQIISRTNDAVGNVGEIVRPLVRDIHFDQIHSFIVLHAIPEVTPQLFRFVGNKMTAGLGGISLGNRVPAEFGGERPHGVIHVSAVNRSKEARDHARYVLWTAPSGSFAGTPRDPDLLPGSLIAGDGRMIRFDGAFRCGGAGRHEDSQTQRSPCEMPHPLLVHRPRCPGSGTRGGRG